MTECARSAVMLDGEISKYVDTLDGREKTIAILGDRGWAQAVKQEGDKMRKPFLCSIRNQRIERPNVGGVFNRSRSGAPSRKGFRGQWSND